MYEQSERSAKGGRKGLTVKSEEETPAVACSLSSTDYLARIRRFADLNRESLLEFRRLELGAELVYSSSATCEVRDLVQLEEECCPFLHFHVEPGPKSIKLSITVPESARDSVDALLEPFHKA
jgi:hypothetical protein